MLASPSWLWSSFALIAGLAMLTSTCLAGEQKISIHDYTGRGFPPDLVQYTVKAPESSWDKIRVIGEDGKQIPCQVLPGNAKGEGVLQFVTALPANSTFAATVRDAGGERATGGVAVTKEGADVVLSNALLAVKLPGEIDKQFEPAVPASTLPAPILAFRHAGGGWLGQSAILTDKKVKSLRIKLVAGGSVNAGLIYDIQWADGGYYRASIQVIDRVPLAVVREEYDRNVLDGSDFWELDLSHGWKPDHAQTASHNGNGGGDPVGRTVDFAALLAGQPANYIVCDQAWGKLSHVGIFSEADSKATPRAYPFVAVIPLRKGVWRRSNSIEVRSANANDLRCRFPMSARNAQWPLDITSETSEFSTLEHDPSLPKTYGRRIWGLALDHPAIPDTVNDKPVFQLQRIYGIIGLDRYKDFILDWPDGKPTYPRLYRGTLAASAVKTDACLAQLRAECNYYFLTTCSSHHATAANYDLAALADAVLGQPGLPPETRREIRSLLALLTYVYEDADMESFGNGHHHGNPNMGTARYWSGPTFMALVPDHPLFAAWRDHMALYGQYNMGNQVAPGGGYLEFGAAYHMHGFARTTNGLPGLESAGATNFDHLLTVYADPDWRYYMNLLTPYDSRWRSRLIPGMANSQPGNTEHFIEAAGLFARKDPALAANLAWAYQANGAHPNANMALGSAAPKPVEPALTSQIFPGVGVIFRAHQGPDETYMLLRAGFLWSHWTEDPGHFIMMSRGAVLVPSQPFQYGDSTDPTYDTANTIRFGHPANRWPHSWGDSTILDHTFGKSVDYAWAATGFPEWFIKPGVSPTWKNTANVGEAGQRKLDTTPNQVEGAFEWNRQVLFMKGKTATSPNYFVFRDTMPGEGKLASYLYLKLLGQKKDVKVAGGKIMADTEWPTKLDVTFAQPATIAPDMLEQRFPLALHNANLGERVGAPGTISPNWVKKDGTPWVGTPSTLMHENQTILRIAGAPGAGYFWVLYPRGADEAPPQVAVPADGVMKITHPEGTDYIFLGSSPVSYEGEGVTFHGRAGAVRLDKSGETVTLMKSEGEGQVGYKGRMTAGPGSYEETFALGQRPAGDEKLAAADDVFTLPAPAATEKEAGPGFMKGSLEDGVTRYRLQANVPASKDGDARLEGGPAIIEISKDKVRFIAARGAYVQLSAGTRGARGLGPFDLTFTEKSMAGKVDGDTRSLVVTWPNGVTRPMFKMDGVRYANGWADDHCIGKGTDRPEFSIGLGVTAGPHAIEIAEWEYPAMPPEPQRREIGF